MRCYAASLALHLSDDLLDDVNKALISQLQQKNIKADAARTYVQTIGAVRSNTPHSCLAAQVTFLPAHTSPVVCAGITAVTVISFTVVSQAGCALWQRLRQQAVKELESALY